MIGRHAEIESEQRVSEDCVWGLSLADKSHGYFWLPAANGVSEVGMEWEVVFSGAFAEMVYLCPEESV